MSVHFSDPILFAEGFSRIVLPFAVLLVSLAGSWHCAAMCGGLISVAAPHPRAIGVYHVGRFAGYGMLGGLAGVLGKYTLASSLSGILPWMVALSLGVGFIAMGVLTWSRPPHVKIPEKFLTFYSRMWGKAMSPKNFSFLQPLSVGLLSVFLPCGWLYSFLLAAVATQSPLGGVVLLFAFWLGTLPALSLTPLLVRKILAPLSKRVPKLTSVLLIGIGLFTLGLKLLPLIPHGSEKTGAILICPIQPRD